MHQKYMDTMLTTILGHIGTIASHDVTVDKGEVTVTLQVNPRDGSDQEELLRDIFKFLETPSRKGTGIFCSTSRNGEGFSFTFTAPDTMTVTNALNQMEIELVKAMAKSTLETSPANTVEARVWLEKGMTPGRAAVELERLTSAQR